MEEITKRILLVEDDPNFGTVLKEYLTINDYEVVLAKNGMEVTVLESHIYAGGCAGTFYHKNYRL